MSYSSNSSYYRPSLFGGFQFFPPVIKALLISNVAIWLVSDLLLRPFTIQGIPIGGSQGIINYYCALFPLGTHFLPWQLLTYMFLHGGFMHLLFNMFALWMFGMELENSWGSKKFLLYYLICGVGAGLSTLFIGPLFGQAGPTVGASGAIYGVLVAFGMIFPDRPIFIYFIVPIKARYFVLFYMFLEVYAGVVGSADGIAHFAHLGGAAVGLIYLLIDRRQLPFKNPFARPKIRVFTSERVNEYSPYDSQRISDAKYHDVHEDDDRVNQQQIDEILDKISQSGYKSLTEREKKILFDASKKLN